MIETYMILTTTPTVEGRQIKEYKGLVFGEVVNGVNFLKDFGASIRNIIGGCSGSYENELIDARSLGGGRSLEKDMEESELEKLRRKKPAGRHI